MEEQETFTLQIREEYFNMLKNHSTPDVIITNEHELQILDVKFVDEQAHVIIARKKPIILMGVACSVGEYLQTSIAERIKNIVQEQKDLLDENPYLHYKFEHYDIDLLILEEIRENKREINYRARFKQWSGKQLKQKNNRRQNRIAYNHGKHRKK